MQLISVLIVGIAVGSVYALMALAINIVFSARRVVNFAQGDMAMLAALIGATAISSWGLPYLFGLLVAGVSVALLALAIERLAVRPLSTDESNITWILSIVAVAIIVANSSILIFGTEPQTVPGILSNHPASIAGLRVVPNHLAVIGGTVAFMVLFHVVQNRTIHGKAMRAAARDPAMATMLGIPVRRYIAGAFIASGVMAAVAGFLVGPMTFASAQLGFALGIKGFAAAALGGLGVFRGAVAGGLLLGIAETLSSTYIGSTLKDSVSLVALCLILIFRPTGILGEARIAKM
jgi:branched-chain amino acid transport system permease protein